MGNTVFYEEAKHGDAKVVWKDLFSESRKKHTPVERAYALSVGTPLNQPSEDMMLKKWHKPWLWYVAAKFGLGIFAATIVLYVLLLFMGFSGVGVDVFYLVVLPQIVPLIVMVFLWELNVPQNISIWELIAFYFVGGLLSFVFLNPMFLAVPSGLPASFAALREEPPKLLAGIVILWYLDKKAHKRIYGMTGLVVGAAVGAGFAAFESVLYSLNNNGSTVLLRALVGVGGHMVYAAPYVAAYASGLRKTGSYIRPLFTADFLLALAGSIGVHALWNSNLNTGYVTYVLFIGVKWMLLFYWMRKYLVEVLTVGQSAHRRYTHRLEQDQQLPVHRLTVTCVRGRAKGLSWVSTGGPLTFGREADCNAKLPADAPGVSRHQCQIQLSGDRFTIKDLNSSYGTYLTGGKLPAMQEYGLSDGEHIYMGSKQEAFYVNIQNGNSGAGNFDRTGAIY